MTIYNHMFTLAFSIETERPCNTDSNDSYPAAQELIAALRNRINDPEHSSKGCDVLEAIGSPDDTYIMGD